MSKKEIDGITKIAVKGFKSIAEECAIDIRPLTVLAGANSSGKSSIMQPLLMLKQTLEAPYDPGPLLLDGPNVQFTEAKQFLSKLIDKKGADRFQILVENRVYDVSYLVATTFKKGSDGIEIAEMMREIMSATDSLAPSLHLTLYPGMPLEEAISQIDQYPMSRDFKGVKRFRCFLGFEPPDSSGLYDVTYPLEPSILNTLHLPGLRGNPERIYKLTSTGPRYPGTFEHYTASLIHEWQETKDKRLKILGNSLHILGLTGQVGTRRVSDVGIEVQIDRFPSTKTDEADMVSIADVGIGVSQVLPVLVAVIAADPGQLVYLEQPELHLHPRAQAALAQVLANAAKRGVRVVVETHSSLLLLGLQTLVAEGDLSPELVKLHWFTRREDGATEVTSADLDDAGAYGDWPEDFDDVDLKTQSRYLNAVDRLHFGKEETS